MGEGANIDPRMQAALARLTDNEKECLRRRLQQQTAKEMALELGVSPHAVEKRLKMARTKLGLSSSLEAARLLATSEGHRPTGPQTPDLDPNSTPDDKPASRSTIIGVLAMSLVLVAATVIFLAQPLSEGATISAERSTSPSPSPENGKLADGTTTKIGMGDFGNVVASTERALRYARQLFHREDSDSSGFIELAEAPRRLEMGEPRAPDSPPPSYSEATIVRVFEGDAAQAEYIRHRDMDGDGRIAFEEYAAGVVEYYEQRGIPLVPDDWTRAPIGKR